MKERGKMGTKRLKTHHLQTLEREERVLVRPWPSVDGLAVDGADLARVREEHPDGVERDGEEVAE